MPELPEVESIRKQLEKFLVRHLVKKVEVNWRKSLPEGEDKIIGAKIEKVHRFGKILEIELSNKFSLVIHVKMTGQLIYRGPNLELAGQLSRKIIGGVPGKHTHVVFYLDKGGILYFNDVRKFGWIRIIETEKAHRETMIGKMGLEPLKDLTAEKFENILKSSKRPVKLVIMDQTKIAGVGNIYANDALWLAKIHPKKESKKLGNEEIRDLYDAIHKVLKKGIEKGGSSENSYVTPDGGEGEYQHFTLIYGKEGEVCERCHLTKFEKFFLSGRGTYFCPNCQKY